MCLDSHATLAQTSKSQATKMRLILPLALFATLAFAIPQSAADYRGRPNRDDDRHGRRPRPRPHQKCVKYWDLCHDDWNTCDPDEAPASSYDFTKVIEFARSAPNCNPVLCLHVLAVAPCIDKGIQESNAEEIEKCTTGAANGGVSFLCSGSVML